MCPACRRIADRYPAGEVLIGGTFAAAHRAEIESLVRHTADKEGGEHPLHRIMSLRRKAGGLEVTVFQDAKGQGGGGVDAIVKLINGESVPSYVDIPYQLVTPDNLADFLGLN